MTELIKPWFDEKRFEEDLEWYLFIGRLGVPHPRTWKKVEKGFLRKYPAKVVETEVLDDNERCN